MSADCYSTKSLNPDAVVSSRKAKLDTQEPNKVDELLQYESVVSSAENKCSQLKTQLERLKQMYATQIETPHVQPNSSTTARKINPNDYFETPTPKQLNTIKTPKFIRQNSQAIGTDTSGAALGTINNILTGITQTIPVPAKAYGLKSLTDVVNVCEKPVHGVEEVQINSKSKQSVKVVKSRTKFSLRKCKPKITSTASCTNFKKLKKTGVKLSERRHNRSNENQTTNRTAVSGVSRKSKRVTNTLRHTSRDFPKEVPVRSHDLVEIYHNAAIREAKSSDSDIPKKKIIPKAPIPTVTNIPLLNIMETDEKIYPEKRTISCIYRNYTMPTISSRMKQVAKYYMNSFNIKTIPFCPATSTTASHNIGINIQQVMSMVKSRQPIGSLSPTLAYNIGLAAGKWEDQPRPGIITSVTSRTLCSQCPLTKSTVNYQHLQEVAKTIQHETIEEKDEFEEAVSPDTQSIIITGPSGDVKVKNKKQPVWSADSDEKKCTCVAPKGLGFQQIINKFNGTASKAKMSGSGVQRVSIKEPKMEKSSSGEECGMKSNELTPFQTKEKKLKEVLKKLHDEFEGMTKTYDDLVKKSNEGSADKEALKQLELLDKELNHKEEEIVMVMALHNEVSALKQQVRTLKERTSKENISIRGQSSKPNGCNMTTAGLLNKLLQRVHNFQTHYKRR